jgi:hypothetical protein
LRQLCSQTATAFCLIAFFILSISTSSAEPSILIRNNHDLDYRGPIAFETGLPDGFYASQSGRGQVIDGTAHVVAAIFGGSELRLIRQPSGSSGLSEGPLLVKPSSGGVALLWDGKPIGRVEFGLAVIPGREAGPKEAVSHFQALPVELVGNREGSFSGKCHTNGYDVVLHVDWYPGGWMDMDVTLTRTEDGPESVYLALVRRIVMPGMDGVRMRWNGRVLDSTDEPDEYDRVFSLARGVDWCSWKRGSLSCLAVNRFAPGFTYEREPGRWVLANHFYTRERVRREGDSIYLISEIAGPNSEQEKTRYMGVRAYTPPLKGEPLRLTWRLAVSQAPQPAWENAHLLVYAGYTSYRSHRSNTSNSTVVDLGVPWVEFGTSYFPYSTMCENFDFYRTAGLDREGWWPFSPKMWENWRAFTPRMETDLRIIRSMGFDWVRLHHLELVGKMGRQNALAFLDFYMDTCRKLGLKVLVDTAGSPEWMALIAGRYEDVVKSVELENEILIGGIKPGDPARWTACYNAIKQVAPETEVFLTGACNQGMFERLVQLGVPFDRVGFHNYKHGPAWKEASSSIALGVAGHAMQLGKPPILGEFNWKMLTAWSPENRALEFAQIYEKMLEPRAIPEFFQFHWQETLSVNPRLTRQGIRHYEIIHLDRRPKPEGVELMKLIERYARKDAPVREMTVHIEPAEFDNGSGHAGVLIENHTSRAVDVKVTPESFDGMGFELTGGGEVTLQPGGYMKRRLGLSLKSDARPGVYHYFLRVDYSGKTAYGWGIASNPGAPRFDAPVLADLVAYDRRPPSQ